MEDVQRQPDSPFDLTILYMADARAWCEYLFDIFQPYEVYQNSEEITDFPTHETTLNNIRDSRVVIVIVSPVFLDHCSPMLEKYTHQVVALLCGVPEEDLKNLEDTVPSYKNWKIVEAQSGQKNITQETLRLLDGVDSDAEDEFNDYIHMGDRKKIIEEETEGTYLMMEGNVANRRQQSGDGDSDSIYLSMQGNVKAQEPEDEYQTMESAISEKVYEPMTSGEIETEDTYEIMPGGGSNKLPRMPPRVGGHKFDPKNHGYVNEKGNQQYSENAVISPSTIRSGSAEPLFIIFTHAEISTQVEDMYKAVFKWRNGSENVVAIVVNQYTIRINRFPQTIPSGPVTLELLHNNEKVTTLRIQVAGPTDMIAELLRGITNPFEFMCEALNVSPADSNQLDNALYQHCQKHLPPEGPASFHKIFGTAQEIDQDLDKRTEIPTVLHFAAKYKLKTMCSILLSVPGAFQAMQIKNCDGDTPSSLAEKNGDEVLKDFLENYMEEAVLEGNQHPDEIGQVKDGKYVDMKGKERRFNAQYINKGAVVKGSDYDRPFHIPIPAAQTLSRDDTIRSLISGNESDIYSYYGTNSFGAFQRQEEEEDDDDPAGDYEHLDEPEDEPPSRLPPDPTSGSDSTPSSRDDGQVFGNVRITSVAELDKTPRSNPAGIPKEQQALIDLQNRVKNNEITVEDAVAMFKDSHESQFAPKEKGRKLGFWDRKKKEPPVSPKPVLPPPSISPKPGLSPVSPKGGLPPPPVSPKPGPVTPKPGTALTPKSSATLPVSIKPKPIDQGGTSPVMSPRQRRGQDRPPGNFPKEGGFSRPSSTASTISAGSRLSTGSRDSSYGSATEPDEPEGDIPNEPPPAVPRRIGQADRTSRSNVRSKRFSGIKFENDYYDKPLPPIPSRPKQPTPTATGGRAPDDLPMRDPPPAPREQGRRTSDPASTPATMNKPKPQPRVRRPVQQ